MKTRISIMIIGLSLLGAVSGNCQNSSPAYDAIVEHETELASSKIVLKNSKSPNLKLYGASCEKKLSYIVLNWDRLVAEMMERSIQAKPYAVHQYINEAYRRDVPDFSRASN